MATEEGYEFAPVVKSTLGAKLFMSMLPMLVDVFRNTETYPPPHAIAKSSLPSPSKSPMATETEAEPVGKFIGVAKLPVPMLPLMDVLRCTETVELAFATAKSGLPSPSKSPTATEKGCAPVVNSRLA